MTINPIGNLPANSSGIMLQVKLTPTNGSFGTTWKGWSYRKSAATLMNQTTTRFPLWGKAGDPIVVVMSNVDGTTSGNIVADINCAGVTIDSLSPSSGKIGDVITINGSGFGSQSDSRTVKFNGVAATLVTWVSDTQLRVTVPTAAASGNVVVNVNGSDSNTVNFDVVLACSDTQQAGTVAANTRTIELGKTSGTFVFTFRTFTNEDQMVVRYQGNVLFDTGCVPTGADTNFVHKTLSYSGTSSTITVQVFPNCKTFSEANAWDYSVSCP